MHHSRVKGGNVASLRNVATLRDVAKDAGVSMMTVSNFVNGKVGLMGPATRARVEKSIEALNYKPQMLARGLRLSRSFIVGMLIVDESHDCFLTDMFTSHLVSGLANLLSEHDINTIIHRVDHLNYRKPSLVNKVTMDAACILTAGKKPVRRKIISDLLSLGIPLILFQENLNFDDPLISRIVMNDHEGSETIGKRLASSGARHAVILSKSHTRPALEEKEAGFSAGFTAADPSARCRIVRCGMGTPLECMEIVRRLIDKGPVPDALFGINDQIALAAIHALGEKGLRIPEDIKVAGFNGATLVHLAAPNLTTFRAPAYDLGHRGAELLIDCLERGETPPRLTVVKGELLPGTTA